MAAREQLAASRARQSGDEEGTVGDKRGHRSTGECGKSIYLRPGGEFRLQRLTPIPTAASAPRRHAYPHTTQFPHQRDVREMMPPRYCAALPACLLYWDTAHRLRPPPVLIHSSPDRPPSLGAKGSGSTMKPHRHISTIQRSTAQHTTRRICVLRR
jgi:hypothetical protein